MTGDIRISNMASVTSLAALNMYNAELKQKYPKLTNSFMANGWQMILTPTLNNSMFGGQPQELAGYTLPTTKTMYIVSDGYEYLVRHEMGHYLDHAAGQKAGLTWLTDSPEFQMIYDREGQSLGRAGALDAAEFFAEVFRHMTEDPTNTALTCPEAYLYVSKCLETL